ncbi:hypothetical protein [[Eubacterium] cellulosolvens]
MVWSMVRNPRQIKPGEESVFTIEMDKDGAPLKDVEITFEIDPKDAGVIKTDKIKTDEKGCAIAIFSASEKIDKDLDVMVRAKWMMGDQEKKSGMIVEIRPNIT